MCIGGHRDHLEGKLVAFHRTVHSVDVLSNVIDGGGIPHLISMVLGVPYDEALDILKDDTEWGVWGDVRRNAGF